MASHPRTVLGVSVALALACCLLLLHQSGPAHAAGDVRFAVLGDFGSGNANERAVADMINAQNVEFIATVGDNVYSAEDADPAAAIAAKVTAFYGDWIDDRQFFPLLGNHDWGDPGVPLLACPGDTNSCTGAWFDAFDLPGNERYYSVRRGAVEVFVYSDYYRDPDFDWRDRPNSPMTLWLRDGLATSDATWKIVLMHFPKHSSPRGTPERADLDFAEWGADAVIAGHAHHYERLQVEGIPYFVNGTGGAGLSPTPAAQANSEKIIGGEHGAMIIDANDQQIEFKFLNAAGAVRDTHTLVQEDAGEGSWEWGSVPVGGGGYVTGIVVHPLDPDIVYARTDVGGAYRLDPATKSWVSITRKIPYDDKNLWGIESIAVDPNDRNVVYIAAGERSNACDCDVFRSADRGENWAAANIGIRMGANEPGRWAGERLAVDPNNSSVIYFASRYDGLRRSTTAASSGSFSELAFGPFQTAATSGEGRLAFVAIDPTSSNGDRSQRLYVGVVGVGVYRSTNAGSTWSLLGNSPSHPRQGVVGPDGKFYVSHTSGVVRLDASTFVDITPSGGAREFSGIDVATDPTVVVVAERSESAAGNRVYRSVNRGAAWSVTNLANSAIEDDPATWQAAEDWSWATADVAIDPTDSRTVWIADWFNVWKTPALTTATRSWELYATGHEELVVHDLESAPIGAPLFSGSADNVGFRHVDPIGTVPSAKLFETQDVESVDVATRNTDVVVAAASKNYGTAVGDAQVSYDNGLTWSALPRPYASAEGGEIAVSANGRYVVWIPVGGSAWSLDLNAATPGWTEAAFPNPLGANLAHTRWAPKAILEADAQLTNRFYLLDYRNDVLYQTDDGGRTWYQRASINVAGGDWDNQAVKAHPTNAGEVWLSSEPNGLYRLRAGETSFTRINSASTVVSFGFGAPPPGSSTPSLYMFGQVGASPYAVFQSIDLGGSWTEISDSTDLSFGKSPKLLTGDAQVYGRLYIGTGGAGIYYGQFTAGNNDVVPVARDDLITGTIATSLTYDICANDSFGNGASTPIRISGWYGPGLSRTDCVISGVPGRVGSFTYRYQLVDADGDSDEATVTISIDGGVVDSTPVARDDNIAATVGVFVSFDICANDDDGNGTSRLARVSGWYGPGLSRQGCTVSGVPGRVGTFRYVYRATDDDGDTDDAAVIISVGGGVLDLTPIARDDAITGRVGAFLSFDICANDDRGNGSPTPTRVSGWYGPGLSRSDCVVSGTPSRAGSFAYGYRLTDDDGDSDTAMVGITISP